MFLQESRRLVDKLRDAAEGPQHKWWALAAVSAGVFMSTLDISIVNISLPRIMDDLNANLSAIQWVVLAYLLAISSLLLTFGRLADLMGRKRIYIAGGQIGDPPDPLDFATGDPIPPNSWETGWKDTVIANPGEVTPIIATFDLPGLYVWHCHILEHEDNEMMRPYYVGP